MQNHKKHHEKSACLNLNLKSSLGKEHYKHPVANALIKNSYIKLTKVRGDVLRLMVK